MSNGQPESRESRVTDGDPITDGGSDATGGGGSAGAFGTDSAFATRRTLLKAAAASGAFAALGGSATGQEPGDTIELDGFTEGWEGVAPEEIEGETNPTLRLEIGETYTVEWTNADGVPHDFVILDEDDEHIEGTEVSTEEGETLTLEFEVTEEMAQYYCSIHPATMRGDIQLDDVEEEPEEEPEEDLLIPPGPTIGLETVAEGLTAPVDFQIAPEERDRWFVVDQPGQIYVYEDGELRDEPFLDVSEWIPELGIDNGEGFDERGLLGLTFHPEFEQNGRFFIRYSGERGTVTPANWSHTFVVAEYQADEELEMAEPGSEQRLLEIPQPQFNHNAGPLLFGPDGYLYIAVGDGGDADDTGPGHPEDWYEENEGGSGQNTRDTLLGGMLRIDVDTEEFGKPYGIPEDNPFPAEELPEEEEVEEEREDDDEVDDEVDDNDELDEDDDLDDDEEIEENDDGVDADDDDNPQDDDEVDEDDEVDVDDDDEVDVDDDDEVDVDDDDEIDDNGEPLELAPEDGMAEYYAWGMRNPWGMTFTDDGEFLVADVGQLLFEIVNHVERGGNYGWNVKEGVHCFDTENPGVPPEECPDETPEDVRDGEELIDPIIEYPQEYGVQNIGSAVVGGEMYTNDTVPELQDTYVFGDWSALFAEPEGKLFVSYPPEGWPDEEEPEESFADQAGDEALYEEERWEGLWPIERLRVEADDDLVRDEDHLNRFVLAFGRDHDGELYVLTSARNDPFGDTGQVHRIVAPDEEMVDPDEEEEEIDDEDEIEEEEEIDDEDEVEEEEEIDDEEAVDDEDDIDDEVDEEDDIDEEETPTPEEEEIDEETPTPEDENGNDD